MKKKKKASETIPYRFKAKDGVTYSLIAAHNIDDVWHYDLKDENGKIYKEISYNKIKEYL